jgi:hypothetical protein
LTHFIDGKAEASQKEVSFFKSLKYILRKLEQRSKTISVFTILGMHGKFVLKELYDFGRVRLVLVKNVSSFACFKFLFMVNRAMP